MIVLTPDKTLRGRYRKITRASKPSGVFSLPIKSIYRKIHALKLKYKPRLVRDAYSIKLQRLANAEFKL